MADYYPLIIKAVQGLENNTGEARRALYERARGALIDQLRSIDPPLSEADITRERLGLEEAIRKVEAEAARRARGDTRPAPGSALRGSEPRNARPLTAPPPSGPSERARGVEPRRPSTEPPAPRADRPFPPREAGPDLGRRGLDRREKEASERNGDEARAGRPPVPPEAEARGRAPADRPGSGPGRNGLRDIVGEVDRLGEATAQAGRSMRRSYGDAPPPDESEIPAPERDERALPEGQTTLEPGEPDFEPAGRATPPPRARRPRRNARQKRLGLPIGLILRLGVIVGLVLVAIGGALWFGPTLMSSFRGTPQATQQKTAENPSSGARPKIPDRVNSGDAQPAAAVAQRVVLYEEDPSSPQGKQYVGAAVWRNETTSAGPGKPAEITIRADIEVPERKLALAWVLRRNLDQTLPASHTIEVTFNLPPDFDGGGIDKVPGVLMKQSEQTRGVPLAGIAVKVTPTFFLIGLSAVDADRERNVQMLKERQWFDVPIVYANQKRAILAIEKGSPGDRAFQDAFAAWSK